MMNLGGFVLLRLSYYGLYGLDPYTDDFLLITSQLFQGLTRVDKTGHWTNICRTVG